MDVFKDWQRITNNDTRFSPLNSKLFAIFISDDEFALGSEELLVPGESIPIWEVVEYGKQCVVVPEVQAKGSVEVHMASEGSDPFGFASS